MDNIIKKSIIIIISLQINEVLKLFLNFFIKIDFILIKNLFYRNDTVFLLKPFQSPRMYTIFVFFVSSKFGFENRTVKPTPLMYGINFPI